MEYRKHLHTIGSSLRWRNAYHGAVADRSRRPDLAAMLAPLLRELIAAEEPVLAAHDVTT